MVSSKQPKLGLTQELSSRISESTTGYTFIPCVGSFTSPGIDTRWKGPPAISVSSERHRQMWGDRNCLSFETAVGGIEPPSHRLTDRRSTARQPTPPPHISLTTFSVSSVQFLLFIFQTSPQIRSSSPLFPMHFLGICSLCQFSISHSFHMTSPCTPHQLLL